MPDLIAAEWLKLRSTRLLHGMLPIAVVITGAAVAGATLNAHGANRGGLDSTEALRQSLSVMGAGALIVLVLGILLATGEQRHGTASDTFLTTPRRHHVVLAKLVVGGLVGLSTGTVIAAAGIAVARVVYGTRGASFPLTEGDVWLIAGGALAYSTLFAIMGVALGALVRNQVVAVAAALVWFAMVEHTLVNLLPGIGRWLPVAAGQAVMRTPLDGLVSPLSGAGLLMAYAAAIALAGAWLTAVRDV